MRYQLQLHNAEIPGGYSGAQMGSGRNSGEQERESWKDDDVKKPGNTNESDGNSTTGASNEFNTDLSRSESNVGLHDLSDKNDLGNQLDNSM